MTISSTHLFIALAACVKAGDAVMEVYASDFEVAQKADDSPLTLADRRSHDVISGYLDRTGIPVLSEEGRSISCEERRGWEVLWIIDPLDGTKEFIKRNGEFTVNIALVEKGEPVFGAVFVPAKRTLYFGAKGLGSYKIQNPTLLEAIGEGQGQSVDELIAQATSLPVDATPPDCLKIVGSRSHLTEEVKAFVEKKREEYGEVKFVSAGSSLKICLVAEGTADIYPRLGPTMEWDIAAGHAVAENAGARFYCFETGGKMVYNREDLLNPWFVVERKPAAGS